MLYKENLIKKRQYLDEYKNKKVARYLLLSCRVRGDLREKNKFFTNIYFSHPLWISGNNRGKTFIICA